MVTYVNKTLKNYLNESVHRGKISIKFAFSPSDAQFDAVERYLKRFGLTEIQRPVEVDNDGLDFYNIPNHRVFKIQAEVQVPISPYVLQTEIKSLLNVSENFVLVRNEQEPVEQSSADRELELEQHAQAAAQGLSKIVRLSTDRLYRDDEQPADIDMYGNEYNKNFLGYLSDIARTRKSDRVEPSDPLFSWLQMDEFVKSTTLEPVQDMQNFNSHITDAPLAAGKISGKLPIDHELMNRSGGFADVAQPKTEHFEKSTRSSRNSPRISK